MDFSKDFFEHSCKMQGPNGHVYDLEEVITGVNSEKSIQRLIDREAKLSIELEEAVHNDTSVRWL